MSQFRSRYYANALRTGLRTSEKLPGNWSHDVLDAQGNVVEHREGTYHQLLEFRRAQERIAKMTPEQKAALLAELEAM